MLASAAWKSLKFYKETFVSLAFSRAQVSKRKTWFILDSKYEVTLHPFALSSSIIYPVTKAHHLHFPSLNQSASLLLYHCGSTVCKVSSVHGLHGTVSMHVNPTYLFKKPLPLLKWFHDSPSFVF